MSQNARTGPYGASLHKPEAMWLVDQRRSLVYCARCRVTWPCRAAHAEIAAYVLAHPEEFEALAREALGSDEAVASGPDQIRVNEWPLDSARDEPHHQRPARLASSDPIARARGRGGDVARRRPLDRLPPESLRRAPVDRMPRAHPHRPRGRDRGLGACALRRRGDHAAADDDAGVRD